MKKLLIPLMLIACAQHAQAQADPTRRPDGTLKPNYLNPVVRTIEYFGAIPNDGLDDSKAFMLAAEFFDSNSGNVNYNNTFGILQLGRGTYEVGTQTIDNSPTATIFAHAKYQAFYQNLDGLVIQGKGIKETSVNMRRAAYFGYYAPGGTPQYGNVSGSIGASNGWIFGLSWSAKNVIIRDMEMNGNSDSYNVGLPYEVHGDFNQISSGIYTSSMKSLSLENLNIHNFGEDGIYLESDPEVLPEGKYHVYMQNVSSRWNGRQALSWVHGRDILVENSTFGYTRLLDGTYDDIPNQPAYSPCAGSPGANIDIEPGYGWSEIRNGHFKDCKILGNAASTASLAIQLNSDSITFDNCVIKCFHNTDPNIEAGFFAIGFESVIHRNFTFNNCDIEGCINFHKVGYQTQYLLPDEGYTRFNKCTITQSYGKSNPGMLGAYALLATYDRVLLNSCYIKQINERPLFQVLNVSMNGQDIPNPDNYLTLNDCTIESEYDPNTQYTGFLLDSRMYAMRFTGNTEWRHTTLTPACPNENFLQNVTVNGGYFYDNPNRFTFAENDSYLGYVGGTYYFNSNFDLLAAQRPVIFGETPCEYLNVNIGFKGEDGMSALKNDLRPLYIGENTILRIGRGSLLDLSGDIYLAGKIIVEDGAYFLYNAGVDNTGYNANLPVNIHYLGSTNIQDHFDIAPGAFVNQQPVCVFTWPPAINVNFIPHTNRSELLAPQQYLRSDIDIHAYDDEKFVCPQISFWDQKKSNLNGISITDKNDFIVSPNPATDKAMVSNLRANEVSDIQLLDINGKQLFKTTSNGNDVQLSLKDYPQGTYLIRVSSASHSSVKKVIKN